MNFEFKVMNRNRLWPFENQGWRSEQLQFTFERSTFVCCPNFDHGILIDHAPMPAVSVFWKFGLPGCKTPIVAAMPKRFPVHWNAKRALLVRRGYFLLRRARWSPWLKYPERRNMGFNNDEVQRPVIRVLVVMFFSPVRLLYKII